MKCRFKTNKPLTAIKETKHTIPTSEGGIIHIKLASKSIKFQLPRKLEEGRKPTNRCSRCGKFCQGEYCDTHNRLYGIPKDRQQASSSHALPTTPQKNQLTAISSKPMRKWTFENHKPTHRRTKSRKTEAPPYRKYHRRKTTHPKQIRRRLPHQLNAVPATVCVRPRREINHRPRRYAQPLLPKSRRKRE